MSTIIYPSPIFGPVRSRRLGISLGINLMPDDGKVCTFDCIYCECGFNADRRPHHPRPTREMVRTALEERLRQMKNEGQMPDVLTFAGNGEPTAHPDFAGIINATLAHRPEVREALLRVDNNILKLDTVDADYIQRVNAPTGKYDVNEVIKTLQSYNGHLIIQTLFMKGTSRGLSVDNTGEAYVGPWLKALESIAPSQVMIYTIDRETPDHDLRKATPEELDRIAERVGLLGFPVSVSY